MRKSKINVEVELDDQNIPEKITWSAEDNQGGKEMEAKAISLSFWDGEKSEALNLDLWIKEMDVVEMKKFYVNLLGTASNTLLNATGDEFMSTEIANMCEKFVEYLKKQ
ncbi:gliding motility protein GldC [Reichenbachiella versicolor]|uniref:gliding motility protein GldC n=1 Tax=Reichenbachiella versicolor TaxID=1821036 RepID=UPI000D6E87DF|nr:gliding motility protein GldC [Reichenbachiella versicolor]